MRFGFKTSPQDTSWDDLLDGWRAADDIDADDVEQHQFPEAVLEDA